MNHGTNQCMHTFYLYIYIGTVLFLNRVYTIAIILASGKEKEVPSDYNSYFYGGSSICFTYKSSKSKIGWLHMVKL